MEQNIEEPLLMRTIRIDGGADSAFDHNHECSIRARFERAFVSSAFSGFWRCFKKITDHQQDLNRESWPEGSVLHLSKSLNFIPLGCLFYWMFCETTSHNFRYINLLSMDLSMKFTASPFHILFPIYIEKLTSSHSIEPNIPYSSPSQLQNTIDLLGLQPKMFRG